MFYRVVSAQNTRITSFDAAGYLTWSNSVPNAACRIAWSGDLSEVSTHPVLSPVMIALDYSMRVKVPMKTVGDTAILSIYSNGWGDLMETWILENGVPTQVYIEEEYPYFDPPAYYGYAHQENGYTALYHFTSNSTFMIKKEAVPQTPWTMTGVIFGQQGFFNDHYLSMFPVQVTGPEGALPPIQTDDLGRYMITNSTPGEYVLNFTYDEFPFSFTVTNTAAVDYQDLYFRDPFQAAAPNIYIYPEEDTNVMVSLAFPCGGHITVSEPVYNSGWHVQVDTNGLIESQFDYLFYEALLDGEWNTAAGWVLDGQNIETELRTLLAQYGFIDREIDDFIEYWIPVIEGSDWYAVYPQNAVEILSLNITPTPDNLLRGHFIIRALNQRVSLPAPEIQPFHRAGFTVAEWGVWGWSHPAPGR